MADLVYREHLDQARCECDTDTCNHDVLVMHSRCHPEAPTWAIYSNGALRIECAECGGEVFTVAIASERPPRPVHGRRPA